MLLSVGNWSPWALHLSSPTLPQSHSGSPKPKGSFMLGKGYGEKNARLGKEDPRGSYSGSLSLLPPPGIP